MFLSYIKLCRPLSSPIQATTFRQKVIHNELRKKQ